MVPKEDPVVEDPAEGEGVEGNGDKNEVEEAQIGALEEVIVVEKNPNPRIELAFF